MESANKQVKIKLRVELPFWLRMDNCALSLDRSRYGFDKYVKTIQVDNDIWKLYGGQVISGEQTMVYVGHLSEFSSERLKEDLEGQKVSLMWQKCKTVMFFECIVDEAITQDLYNEKVKEKQALQSFILRVMIHTINGFIKQYRFMTYDQMVYRVGAWDVPNWVIEEEGKPYVLINLFRYKTFTELPTITDKDGTRPWLLTKCENFCETAGELGAHEEELLDAYNYATRGDYKSALKSAVTAFEITLDLRLLQESVRLASQKSDNEGKKVFEEFKNDFEEMKGYGQKLDLFKRIVGKELKEFLGKELWGEVVVARKHRHILTHTAKNSVEAHEHGDIRKHIDHLRWAINMLEGAEERAKLRDDMLLKSKLELIDFID